MNPPQKSTQSTNEKGTGSKGKIAVRQWQEVLVKGKSFVPFAPFCG
jgi:hypothetical protein